MTNYVDKVCVCFENNINSILNTFQILTEEVNKTEVPFRGFMIKTRFIVTKFNHMSMSGKKQFDVDACKIIIEGNFDELADLDIGIVGVIPLTYDFVSQMNVNKPIVRFNDKYLDFYSSLYSNI